MERLGLDTSVIGMGCWQIGGSWGEVPESDALATLHAAADAGVTFFDTADVSPCLHAPPPKHPSSSHNAWPEN